MITTDKHIMDSRFTKNESISLIKRLSGFAFFSEKSEDEAINFISDYNECSMKEILGVIIIFGVKNFDSFDINALCKGADYPLREIETIFEIDKIAKLIPIKIKEESSNKNVNRINKEIDKIKKANIKNISDKKTEILLRNTLNRFDKWIRKGRILVLK